MGADSKKIRDLFNKDHQFTKRQPPINGQPTHELDWLKNAQHVIPAYSHIYHSKAPAQPLFKIMDKKISRN
jgi:hypothetical protein